ncbi:MAG: S8 family serine peptidase [Candidatus Krumholzibacteriota bacterium]|nr:S8 family serine peptidase [Candidatus Krumholzibacteriota bacterium]
MKLRKGFALFSIYAALIVIFIFCVIVPACDNPDEPEMERLGSFRVSVPDTVTAGVEFALTVTAVGSEGTSPFTSFNGYVTLTSSEGTLSPDTLQLVHGIGSNQVVLSSSTESQTVTATGSGKNGSVIINATFMTVMQGDPEDPAEEAIPEFSFVPNKEEYSTDHPQLEGFPLSFKTVMAVFELGTTVEEANIIIDDLGAEIVGGIAGVAGQAEGIIFLKLPTSTHNEMDDALDDLRANPRVRYAVQDALVGTQAVPQPNNGNPAEWTWENPPRGGNWGHELIRLPQMWNFNGAVEKSEQLVMTGVVDDGFLNNHRDLTYFNLNPDIEDSHGTAVAGIIGAVYNNGIGVDGVNPFTGMIVAAREPIRWDIGVVRSVGETLISSLYDLARRYPLIKVINMSQGYNWDQFDIIPDTNDYAQEVATAQGAVMVEMLDRLRIECPLPIICASAGNESENTPHEWTVDARWTSPVCNAALNEDLDHRVEEIIVVEAIDYSPGTGNGNATRYKHSCVDGHISAPGDSILVTTGQDIYEKRSGTSFAAPYVAGLVGYMLCVDPSLNIYEIKDLLRCGSRFDVGGGAQPRIDAWHSVMDIDRIRGNDYVLRMMCDIDDGTPDGNQRIDYKTGNDYLEEDADGDGGIGDGAVDMSDFRRWRDWYLQIIDDYYLDLDGVDGQHPKKDINGDGEVKSSEEENLYPRGDFNGDGIINDYSTSFVPGAIGADMTDLQVLATIFTDDNYQADELANLISSTDIHIDASGLLEQQGTEYVAIELRKAGTSEIVQSRLSDEPYHVLTAPCLVQETYEVKVISCDQDIQEINNVEKEFTCKLGGDVYWKPVRSLMYLAVYFPTVITDEGFGDLEIMASYGEILGGIDITITAVGGWAEESSGVTDANGAFSTCIHHDGISEQIMATVKAEADDGTFAEETVYASVDMSSNHEILIYNVQGHVAGHARATNGETVDSNPFSEETTALTWDFNYSVDAEAYNTDGGDTLGRSSAQSFCGGGYNVMQTGNTITFSAHFSSSGSISSSGDEMNSGAEGNAGVTMMFQIIKGHFVCSASGFASSPNCDIFSDPANPNLNFACGCYGVEEPCGARYNSFEVTRVLENIRPRINVGASAMSVTAGASSSITVDGTIEPINLGISNNKLSFGSDGGSLPLSVDSNINWKLIDLEELPGWIRVDTRLGSRNGKILVTVSPLRHGPYNRIHHFRLIEASGYSSPTLNSPIIRVVQSR